MSLELRVKNYLQLNLSLLYWILIAPFTGQFFKIAPIFRQMVFIGVRAAPMVALTAFSVGVTLAMQAAHSLQSLGAEMYIPDLVMLTLLREMGPVLIAVIVIGREFLVSGLRSIAASEGFTIEASDLGKFKMLVQIIAVTAAIVDARWAVLNIRGFIVPVELIAYVSMGFMVGLSLLSAIDYFVGFWKKIDRRVRRRRAFVLSRRKRNLVAGEISRLGADRPPEP